MYRDVSQLDSSDEAALIRAAASTQTLDLSCPAAAFNNQELNQAVNRTLLK